MLQSAGPPPSNAHLILGSYPLSLSHPQVLGKATARSTGGPSHDRGPDVEHDPFLAGGDLADPAKNFRTNPPMRLRPSTQPQWHRHRVGFLTGAPGPGVGRAPAPVSPSRRPPPALVSGLPFESTTLNKNKCHRRRRRSRKLQYLTSGGVPPRAGLDRPDPWARNASLPTLIQQYGGQNAPKT